MKFEHPSQIVNIQMQRASDQHLHYEEHQRVCWEGIFNRDPHEPWTPEIDSFLQSQELASIPMVDIQARLWGHLMVNSARRLPRGSDREDIEIMTMTLPYCDIVTTDSYMQKEAAKDLRLTDSYRSKVLSCKLEDTGKLTVMLAH